jgi:putative ABC transport system substrate-binding protein
VAAFREGLGETGYVDHQNVTIEYHWLAGETDRLAPLMADLTRRHVGVIGTPGTSEAAIAATVVARAQQADRRTHAGRRIVVAEIVNELT